MEGFSLVICGQPPRYFSTMEKAHKWKNDYITEFPAASVRNGGEWEIKKTEIPKDAEVDPPMTYKRPAHWI